MQAASIFNIAQTCQVIGPQYNTGSRPILCLVDGRRAVVKGIHWLPERSMVLEALGHALAPLVGARVPDWAFFRATRANPVDDGQGRLVYDGHVLASFMVPDALEPDDPAVDKYKHDGRMVGSDISAIWVFDQWTRSPRHGCNYLHARTAETPDQLLTYAIDHQVYFNSRPPGPTATDWAVAGDAIQSLHQYVRMMKWSDLAAAFGKLQALPEQTIAGIVHGLPDGRDMLTAKERDVIAAWLTRRARFLGANGVDITRRHPLSQHVRP